MIRHKHIKLALITAFFLIASPGLVQAGMSKSQAVAEAKKSHSGKVLSVDLVRTEKGRNTYRVKILLPDGRVKTVTVSG